MSVYKVNKIASILMVSIQLEIGNIYIYISTQIQIFKTIGETTWSYRLI